MIQTENSTTRGAKPRSLTSLETARSQMAYVWTYGCVVVILLIVVRTVNIPQHAQELWTWALPTIMPTAGLIFSVMASTAIVHGGARDAAIFVRRGFFVLARAVSIFYLALLAAWVLVGATIVSKSIMKPVEQSFAAATAGLPVSQEIPKSEFVQGLMIGNYFLSPLQSLVVGLMSAMFFTRDKDGKDANEKPEREPSDPSTGGSGGKPPG